MAKYCICGKKIGWLEQRLQHSTSAIVGSGQPSRLCRNCSSSILCGYCGRSARRVNTIIGKAGTYYCSACELELCDPHFANRLREPLPQEIAFCGFVLLCSVDAEYAADVRNLPFEDRCVRCLRPTNDDAKVMIGVPVSQNEWLSRKYVRHTLYLNVPFCETCRRLTHTASVTEGQLTLTLTIYFKIRIHNAGAG